MPDLTNDTNVPHPTGRFVGSIGWTYVVVFLVIPVCGYLFPFLAQKVACLQPLSETRWDHILDYGNELRGQNADIVIFGDSTATHNIDTSRLSRRLGMKVLNIPENMPSLPILEDSRLRRYLSMNMPPRLIVFYFARWEMNFTIDPPGDTFDGVQQVIRHEAFSQFIHVASKHPTSVLEFPFEFYKSSTRLTSLGAWKLKPPIIVQGYTPFRIRDMSSLDATCSIPEATLAHKGSESVRRLVQSFTSLQTKTLAYINPVPDCRNAAVVQSSGEAEAGAALPTLLPPDYFSKDGSFAHMLPDFTPKSTDLLYDAIKSKLEN